ncbi:MAG: family 20 glycosylhydrolase [Bacteroidales bacterium]|nr:family 20 glycosylhydrolase [Bacteroidales bacterium]
MKKIFAALVALVFSVTLFAQSTPNQIIPKVASYSLNNGVFILKAGSTAKINADEQNADYESFKSYVEASDLALNVKNDAKNKEVSVEFKIGSKALKNAKEGAYQIDVTKTKITVKASTYKGAFYAVQSLVQLQYFGKGMLACCQINDEPRYEYRGLMFDVVRHFRSKKLIFKQLDLMALLKMSRMHFHLTDNEGWRIQLDCAPEMTQKAAFGESEFFTDVMTYKKWDSVKEPKGYVSGTTYHDGKIYGGYYSKEDIREIIAYAAERHIEIIPEIELPGHNQVLLRVHPELYCTGKHPVNNVVCAGKEESFAFFEKVLKEVMELFPSKYMHIGGDEASKENWKVCPLCEERMKKEGLKDCFELQSYFIRRIEKFVDANGKKLIGWDEILEGGLSEKATVMSWRGTSGGVQSIRMHHDVIMTPSTYYYLDFGQDAPYKEPLAFNAYMPLRDCYNYEPEEDIIKACGGYDENIMKHLLGVQGNLWAECIVKDSHFEYMLYPRAFAIAETGWSPKGSKDYADFRERAVLLCKWLDNKGYSHFKLEDEVGDRVEAQSQYARISQGAKAIVYGSETGERDASILVDGYLGVWDIRNKKSWMEFKREDVRIDVDLKSVKEVHYLGVEFADYNARRYEVPADIAFWVSEDGVNYTQANIPALRLSPDRKHFALLTVGGPVNLKARYIRIEYKGWQNKQKRARTRISEILVN